MHRGQRDWIAIAFTGDGMILAGQLSTDRVALDLTMPRMPLPPIGAWFERAMALAEYGDCKFQPFSFGHKPLSPAAAADCRKKLDDYARYVDRYAAEFTRRYIIDEQCLHGPGVPRSLPGVGDRLGSCSKHGTQLNFETTLAARALPRSGAAPVASVRVQVSTDGEDGFGMQASRVLELPSPVDFGPHAQLRNLLFASLRFPVSAVQLALSYQPGGDATVTVHGHPYIGVKRDALTWIRTDPTRVVSRIRPMAAPVQKLGRAEIRLAPPELGALVLYVDGTPREILPVLESPRVLVRDGELQVISSVVGIEDSSVRYTADFRFVRISDQGEQVGSEDYSTINHGELEQEFHDRNYVRFGGRVRTTLENGKTSERVVEWRYDPAQRSYVVSER